MFSCCFWWFLLGLLAGWLLNWLLCRLFTCRSKCCNKPANCCDKNSPNTLVDNKPTEAPPAATIVDAPKALAPEPVAEIPKEFVLDTAAAKAAGFKLKGPNDLTVVEGIGPKINELFNNAGVVTFAQLASQSISQMQKVLDDAGPRYKLAKPGTWAQQAALASENKWAELKALQDKLNGGV